MSPALSLCANEAVAQGVLALREIVGPLCTGFEALKKAPGYLYWPLDLLNVGQKVEKNTEKLENSMHTCAIWRPQKCTGPARDP